MKTISLTSKNQVTIPITIVRNLGLDKAPRLSIEQRGDEVVLKAQLSLEGRYAALWAKNRLRVQNSFSAADIEAAKAEAWDAHVVSMAAHDGLVKGN